LSRGIALTLKDWLTRLVHVHPFFSEDDIAKGKLWRDEVSQELELNSVGILVLTPENVGTPSPFMYFEAGALSKLRKDARVFTLLVGVKASDVRVPLDAFQHTRLEREDFRKLVQQVNMLAGVDSRDPQQLNEMFDEAWPKLEASVRDLRAAGPAAAPAPQRDANEMMEEVLVIAREIRDGPKPRASSLDEANGDWLCASAKQIDAVANLVLRDISVNLDTVNRIKAGGQSRAVLAELERMTGLFAIDVRDIPPEMYGDWQRFEEVVRGAISWAHTLLDDPAPLADAPGEPGIALHVLTHRRQSWEKQIGQRLIDLLHASRPALQRRLDGMS
jgi:hypothetical protein